jgi:DNA-binding MarR family transcriptional regulator
MTLSKKEKIIYKEIYFVLLDNIEEFKEKMMMRLQISKKEVERIIKKLEKEEYIEVVNIKGDPCEDIFAYLYPYKLERYKKVGSNYVKIEDEE